MKLLIGARERHEGWTTFDIQPGPDVDFVGHCADLSRFPDASVETIYASHVLEHCRYWRELPAALNEWFRVLVPGGSAMISVPDLDRLCRLFVEPGLSSKDRWEVMKMMFGGQVDEHDIHLAGLNFDFLGSYLQDAGFVAIRRVHNFGLFDDFSRHMYRGVAISLNVIAEKPKG